MKKRLFCLLLYYGVAPVYYFITKIIRKSDDQVINHHLSHALVHFFILFLILLCFVLCFLMNGANADLLRKLSGTFPFDVLICIIFGFLIQLWLILWGICLLRAVSLSTHDIPIISKIAKFKTFVNLSFISFILTLLITGSLIIITFQSTKIPEVQNKSAKAYMLYENMESYPRWIFTLDFFRIAHASNSKWGNDSVIVARLSRATLKQAIQNGTFVFISSHGNSFKKGAISFSPDWSDWFDPNEAKAYNTDSNLQYVYIAACWSGHLKKEWEQALAPANIKTFDNISMTSGHIFWLCFKGPKILHSLI